MKRNPGVIGALGAMVLLAVVVTAQAQTRTIFQRISTTLVGDGYTRVGPPRSGWLNDDETARFTVWLTAGSSYVVAAACDVDLGFPAGGLVELGVVPPQHGHVDRALERRVALEPHGPCGLGPVSAAPSALV